MNSPEELLIILPELFVASMACLILLIDSWLRHEQRGLSCMLALLTLLMASLITLGPLGAPGQGGEQLAFADTFVRDGLADMLKMAVYLLAGAVFLLSRKYLADRGLFRGEFYVLGLFAVLGSMVMISAANVLLLYLGLELLALCSYAMVAMHRDDQQATEAAMKYFVLGSLASGMLLYGISMLYGATGTLHLAVMADVVANGDADTVVMAFALAFLLVGLGFKFGAAPFHMWLPDVYQGAPTPVTVFLAATPKLAVFAMAFRLLHDGLLGLHAQWMPMLAVLAVASLAVGNIFALVQTNIKRLLAYSTVSHMGFVLLGILPGTDAGFAAALFYAVLYGVMTTGAFAVIVLLSRRGFEADSLDDFRGLARLHPWYAGMMTLLLFSLAGIPVLVGFFAKLLVLRALIDVGLIGFAIAAVVFSVIGAFYYLRVIKLMYFDEPVHELRLRAEADVRAVVSVTALAQLGLLFVLGPLVALCLRVVQ
jgi:NADH-quinone oxidoreductase subunit N